MSDYERTFLACVSGHDFFVTPVDNTGENAEIGFLIYDLDRDEFSYFPNTSRQEFIEISKIETYTDDLGQEYEGKTLVELFNQATAGYKIGLATFLEEYEE